MEAFNKLVEDMGAHSLEDYPRECVGIITKDFKYVKAKNISSAPNITFFLDPATLVKYDDNIWGIFHSHPGEENPIPSGEDKDSAAFSEYKFIVGFGTKFYIYWYDHDIDALRFDTFKEEHLAS